MTIPPPPPPPPPLAALPLPTLLPAPALPSFEQTKEEAREILLAGATAPLPWKVRRHQDRVLDRVHDALAGAGKGQRLYVLEIAGPIPRVKIGRSNDPWVRIRQHVAEMNGYQYGLIDAHLTTAVDDLLSITRAEAEAHVGVGKRYKPITREAFRDADFMVASLWADVAIQLHQPLDEDAE
ncbi:hypothetical protein ACFYZ8_34270 [Streptomyces sp. NPDC001668]|uniref:hypothetical protein n=1 Tax=Streptomyces sp. NPDC001668 TaxID=3364598 RepID=UPI00367F2B9E